MAAVRTWLADAEGAGMGDHDYAAVISAVAAAGKRRGA
jgi:hypothetical protein